MRITRRNKLDLEIILFEDAFRRCPLTPEEIARVYQLSGNVFTAFVDNQRAVTPEYVKRAAKLFNRLVEFLGKIEPLYFDSLFYAYITRMATKRSQEMSLWAQGGIKAVNLLLSLERGW